MNIERARRVMRRKLEAKTRAVPRPWMYALPEAVRDTLPDRAVCRVQNQSGDAGEIVLYGGIGDSGDPADVTERQFLASLRQLKGKRVTVRINSGGGSAFAGIAMHNLLRSHGSPITTIAESVAASAAAIVFAAGDKRVMTRGSSLMIHNAWGVAVGNVNDHRKMAEVLDKMDSNIASVLASRTGQPASVIRQMMAAETWMDASKAIDLRFATHQDSAARPAAMSSNRITEYYRNMRAMM